MCPSLELLTADLHIVQAEPHVTAMQMRHIYFAAMARTSSCKVPYHASNLGLALYP